MRNPLYIFLLLLIPLLSVAQNPTVTGRSLIYEVSGDPDSIPSLATQSGAYKKYFVVDSSKEPPVFYVYSVSGWPDTLGGIPDTLNKWAAVPMFSSESSAVQTISRVGNDATLSDGGGTISLEDDDSDTTNEIQTVSVVDALNRSLSLGGGTFSIADPDSDPGNELQILSKVGPFVSLSQSGGSVTVPELGMNEISPGVHEISTATNGVYDTIYARPYLMYVAIIDQLGTSAPTATVLQDEIGGISFSYDNVGVYNINSSGSDFTANKTWLSVTNGTDPAEIEIEYIGSSAVQLRAKAGGVLTNELLKDVYLEIRVYP